MTREEAIADAVETFEAQHIDLSNIVREGAAGGNPVLARAARIKALSEIKDGQISGSCEEEACADMLGLFEDCIKDKECRAISGSNGVVEALIRIVKRAVGLIDAPACDPGCVHEHGPQKASSEGLPPVPGSRNIIFAGVSALGTLLIKMPENRRRFGTFGEGPKVVFNVLEQFPTDLAIQDRGFAVVRNSITKDATNASTFSFLGIKAMILDRIREHNERNDPNAVDKAKASLSAGLGAGSAAPPVPPSAAGSTDVPAAVVAHDPVLDAKLLRQASRTVYQMTCGAGASDTKAPEYAKYFGEAEIIPMLLQAATLHAKDPATVSGCCVGCESACVKDEYCASEESQRQIPFLCGLLSNPLFAGQDGEGAADGSGGNIDACCKLASCLAAFARNDENKKLIAASNGVQGGVSLMDRFPANANVQLQVMKLLSGVTLRQPGICEGVAACGGHSATLKAMRANAGKATLVRFGCLLIRNLVSRNKDLQQPILDDGAEPILRAARQMHSICEDVAYACLRDLGCPLGDMKHYRDQCKAMHGMFTDQDRTDAPAGRAENFNTSTKMSENMPVDLDKAAEDLGLA